jgi:hypothetical protein
VLSQPIDLAYGDNKQNPVFGFSKSPMMCWAIATILSTISGYLQENRAMVDFFTLN